MSCNGPVSLPGALSGVGGWGVSLGWAPHLQQGTGGPPHQGAGQAVGAGTLGPDSEGKEDGVSRGRSPSSLFPLRL